MVNRSGALATALDGDVDELGNGDDRNTGVQHDAEGKISFFELKMGIVL